MMKLRDDLCTRAGAVYMSTRQFCSNISNRARKVVRFELLYPKADKMPKCSLPLDITVTTSTSLVGGSNLLLGLFSLVLAWFRRVSLASSLFPARQKCFACFGQRLLA